MVVQASVVISTVGPYLKYGIPLVESCVRNKTHYVDLTGEPLFIKEIMEKYHEQAAADRVLIVPSTGFDSLPSDISAFLVAQALAKKGFKTGSVRYHLIKAKGGVSGGTYATMNNTLSLPWKQLAIVQDPYCLVEPNSNFLTLKAAEKVVTYLQTDTQLDKLDGKASPFFYFDIQDTKKWQTYFFMENTNTRYVRRTASLLEYGPKFKYSEVKSNKSFRNALVFTCGIVTMMWSVIFPPVRWFISWLFPPGTGPSKEARDNGVVHIETFGDSEVGPCLFENTLCPMTYMRQRMTWPE